MSHPMLANPARILEILRIETPLIGVYDAPDTKPFGHLVQVEPCLFSAFENWMGGERLLITNTKYTCTGLRYWLCGEETLRKQEASLIGEQKLKTSSSVVNRWMDAQPPYHREHSHLVIGPLKEDQEDFLRSVTFLVTPDQLSALVLGAQYWTSSTSGWPVMVPFGTGCAQMAQMLTCPLSEALVGGTAPCMREHLPADVLLLTVTLHMFGLLCALDDDTFFSGPEVRRMQEAHSRKRLESQPKFAVPWSDRICIDGGEPFRTARSQ